MRLSKPDNPSEYFTQWSLGLGQIFFGKNILFELEQGN